MRRTVSGLRAWLIQRVSAVYMLVFILFVLLHFLLAPPRSYEAWNGWVSSPAITVAVALFFIALLAHAWVGVRDVMMDYVTSAVLRVGSLALLAVALLATSAWVVTILVRASYRLG
jgi:succinate dehydrogenase / fumarate reductase membrane anchor subunit